MLKAVFVAAMALVGSGVAQAADLDLQFADQSACQSNETSLVLVNGAERVTMRSIVANTRTAARGFGFGGVAQYAVLPGPSAIYRLPNNQPSFLLAAPSNIQPQGLFTLAHFEPRPNGTREVLIGGGMMSYSSGVAPQRTVAVSMQQAPDQRGAPAGSIYYLVTPTAPLPPGEYAMIISIGAQTAAPMMGNAAIGTYYDFGVD